MKLTHDIHLNGHLFTKKIGKEHHACSCGVAIRDSFIKKIVDYQFKQTGVVNRDLYDRSQTIKAIKKTIEELKIRKNELFQ